MFKKVYSTLPAEEFLDVIYEEKAAGWVNGVYIPRKAKREKKAGCVSFIRDFMKEDASVSVVSSKCWKEIEETGYGVYLYEDTSVLSLSLENAFYTVTIALTNPTDKKYSCYFRANGVIKMDSVSIGVEEEKEISFLVPVYQKKLELAFLFGESGILTDIPVEGCVFISSLTIEETEKKSAGKKPTIFLASDSTVQTYESIYYPQTGWGQVLCKFFTSKNQINESACTGCKYPQARVYETEYAIIENRSIGGRSSKSFIEEGKFDDIVKDMKPGDYLFVQWGHNDATAVRPNRYVSAADFQTWLLPYYEACQMTGATCVLVTPVARRNCDESGIFSISFAEYREQMFDFAARHRVAVLDLGKYSTEFLQKMTPEESKSVFLWIAAGQYPDGAYPDGLSDNTHLQYYGATVFADIVAELIRDYTLDEQLDALKKILFPVSVDSIEKPAVFEGKAPAAVPGMVTGFAVQEVTKDGNQANFLLSFHDVEQAVAYHIYRKRREDITFQILKTITAEEKKAATTLPFSASCDAVYQFYVTAVFENGSEGRASRIIELALE